MDHESNLIKKKYLIIIIFLIIINTVATFLIFNTGFFQNVDKFMLNTKFVLLTIGLSVLPFIVLYKLNRSLTINKIILIFFITRILLFLFFTMFDLSVEPEFQNTWVEMAQNIFDGDLFTPYSPVIADDLWRMSPPLVMWWYSYNFIAHEFSAVFLRLGTLLLEFGIVYAMFSLLKERKTIEESNKLDYFRIGLLFYTFSIFSIVFLSLYANISVLSVLLGMTGLIYYYRSRYSFNNIYIAIFFFTLSALTQYIAFFLIYGILVVLLLEKKIKIVALLICEVLIVFGLFSLPLLINDAFGFLSRAFLHHKVSESSWNTTIWGFSIDIYELIPIFIAITIITIYIYQKYNDPNSIEFFTIILSIALIFMPVINPWNYIWILPLISINIVYSIRKYLIANLFFMGYLFLFYLFFAICALVNPVPLDPNFYTAMLEILAFGETIGLQGIFLFFGLPLFHMGLFYLIYSYIKSKNFLFMISMPYIILYINNFLIWVGSLLYG